MSKELTTLQKTLEGMRAEEANMTALLAQHTEELTTLENTTPRNFARMAELEGQRAAVNSMLSRHRARIGDIEGQISSLQAQIKRTGNLKKLGEMTTRIQAQQQTVKDTIQELESTLGDILGRITAAREHWYQERQEAINFAVENLGMELANMHGSQRDRVDREWDALIEALNDDGFPGSAVRRSPCIYPKGDNFIFTTYYDAEPLSPGAVDYLRHRLGHQLPRPILAAIGRAVSDAEDAQSHALRGTL